MANKQVIKAIKRQRVRYRIRKTVVGTAAKPRLSVFRSLSHIYAQLIDDANGVTLAATSTLALKVKSKENKTTSSKSVGLEIAKIAKEKGIAAAIFDRGGLRYHGRIKAVAEGAREGGLKF